MTHPGETSAPPAPTAPRCGRCGRPHLDTLPCWSGKYAQRVTRTVLRVSGRACWVCGGLATTADHVTARALGGTDALENLRPACVSCNSRRGTGRNPFPEDRPVPAGEMSARWRRDA